MKNIYSSNWIKKTKQEWKISIFYFLVIINITVWILFFLKLNNLLFLDGINSILLSGLTLLLGYFFCFWIFCFIKCPHCGYKPFWMYMKESSFNENWIARIKSLDVCPKCKK